MTASTATIPELVLTLWTPKGGTGCSTIAAALALTDRGRDPEPDAHRLIVDASPAGDCAALLGLVASDETYARPVSEGLALATPGPDDHRAALAYTDTPHARFVVVDLGTKPRHALDLGAYPAGRAAPLPPRRHRRRLSQPAGRRRIEAP